MEPRFFRVWDTKKQEYVKNRWRGPKDGIVYRNIGNAKQSLRAYFKPDIPDGSITPDNRMEYWKEWSRQWVLVKHKSIEEIFEGRFKIHWLT